MATTGDIKPAVKTEDTKVNAESQKTVVVIGAGIPYLLLINQISGNKKNVRQIVDERHAKIVI